MNKSANALPKRIISIFLAMCSVFSLISFSSCQSKNSVTMKINNKEISEDIFTYYLDKATVDLGADADIKLLKEKAISYVSTYFKTNSLAYANNIKLSSGEKVAVSEKVNAYWSIYGDYYRDFGITRETLTKVFTSEFYRDALLNFYFGKGGSKEIPETRLYANFKTNYILFKCITGYLTETDENGKAHPIKTDDAEKLVLKFQNMADMVNTGDQSMEEAADYLSSTGYPASVQTVILSRDDTSFPKGFFDKVNEAKPNHAKNIATKEFIFLVLKAEAGINSSYFKDKEPDLLKDVVANDIDNIIESSYKLKVDINEGNLNSYVNVLRDKKSDLVE